MGYFRWLRGLGEPGRNPFNYIPPDERGFARRRERRRERSAERRRNGHLWGAHPVLTIITVLGLLLIVAAKAVGASNGGATWSLFGLGVALFVSGAIALKRRGSF